MAISLENIDYAELTYLITAIQEIPIISQDFSYWLRTSNELLWVSIIAIDSNDFKERYEYILEFSTKHHSDCF